MILKTVELETSFADELKVSNTTAMNPLKIQYGQFQQVDGAAEDTRCDVLLASQCNPLWYMVNVS